LVEVDYGKLVLEGTMTAESHGFPTSRGPIVHGGAIATLADEALASVAFTVAEEGETTVTADLKIDFLRPAKPGRLVARATVRHRTRRMARSTSRRRLDSSISIRRRSTTNWKHRSSRSHRSSTEARWAPMLCRCRRYAGGSDWGPDPARTAHRPPGRSRSSK